MSAWPAIGTDVATIRATAALATIAITDIKVTIADTTAIVEATDTARSASFLSSGSGSDVDHLSDFEPAGPTTRRSHIEASTVQTPITVSTSNTHIHVRELLLEETLQRHQMLSLDYKAPAELFVNNGGRTGRVMTCRRFDQAAEAVRYVKELLPLANAGSTVMEVDEVRYRHADILRLYDSNEYPLPRA